MANLTDPYSTLNPETNSDSPSAKSKGVRFNSATQVTAHNKNRGTLRNISLPRPRGKNKSLILLLLQSRNKETHIKASLISYAIVCAIARSPPSLAYFLPDPQPAPIRG